MVAPHHHRFELDEYVTVEEFSTVKHEFVDGRVYAMAGGTPDHAGISANITALLQVALGTKRCRVFSTDLRVRIRAANVITYPDASVVCDAIERATEDRLGHSILNPTVLVEVLSPSTAAYDVGEKLEYYKQIPSLREVMFVHHDAHRVVVHRRTGSTWVEIEFTDVVDLDSIGCRLEIAAIYRDPLA